MGQPGYQGESQRSANFGEERRGSHPAPPLCESRAVVDELASTGVPVVAIASGRRSDHISRVRIDDFAAGKEITKYLISGGHTRIAHIKGHPNLTASKYRFQGFRAALGEAGVDVQEELVEQGYFTYRSGLKAAEKLLTRKHPPTAVFAGNDDMAAATISVAHRLGLTLPRDLSVVGFDDTATATTVWPELTTIRQPIAAMAHLAIDLLLQKLHRKSGNTDVAGDNVIGYTLVRRGSVASPRRGTR